MEKQPPLPTQAPPPTDPDAVAIDAFERLPDEVRAEIRARRRRIHEEEENSGVGRRRERIQWSISIAVGTFVAMQLLPCPQMSKAILAASTASCFYVVSLFELGRIASGILFFAQAGIACAILRIGAGGGFEIIMVFGFIVLQMVFGVLIGLREEGCLSSD